MPEDLTFLMGKFPARLPSELRYARNHMWCRHEAGRLRFGFTSYAVRLMQDVYFLDWCVDEGATVELKQQVGNIETSKAVADLFAPIAGKLACFNTELLKDPSAINVDNYGPGWLFEMTGDTSVLMDVQGYVAFLEAGWENTQRILKGQINTEE
ncbi:MAG TPA: glycine cleavage system protein H [Gemmataceae bacterium]|nr:glycine cleavage system protein H [Gemmataceae bacterium]